MIDPFDVRSCRKCGCTDNNACYSEDVGACWWVELDLCSACAVPASLPVAREPKKFRCQEVSP